MISPDINANSAGVAGSSSSNMSDKALSQLHKLQEKVRALEKQNAVLRQNRESRGEVPQEDHLPPRPDSDDLDRFELINVNSLQGGEEDWLVGSPTDKSEEAVSTWLRQESSSDPSACIRSPLLTRLADIARHSPVQSYFSPNSSGSSRGSQYTSPLRSYVTSSTPSRLGFEPRSNFDSRTFTRNAHVRGMVAAAAFSLDLGEDSPPVFGDRRGGAVRDASFHRLAFSTPLNRTLDLDTPDCDTMLQTNQHLHSETFSTSGCPPTTATHDGTFSAGHPAAEGDLNNRTFPTLRPGLSDSNGTFSAGPPELNRTFGRPDSQPATSPCDLTFEKGPADSDHQQVLNATFAMSTGGGTEEPTAAAPLNATFDAITIAEEGPARTVTRRWSPQQQQKHGLNSTFNRSNSSGVYGRGEVASSPLGGRASGGGVGGQRKMSEDRLSSASSGNRLSRGSSNDGMLEDMEVLSADMDRLSTTSGMSESSASHRLNDVQDVQDVARMQEESLRDPVGANQPRSATISPSSEQSLCSPLGEEGGGYQSEESCGSEAGGGPANRIVQPRGLPRRGEIRNNRGGYNYANQGGPQYSNQQYSSQDSLPDSPYSSQSLDSHTSQGQDLRRSMPNLNKVRGGGAGGGGGGGLPRPQYGLSRQHTSESRLQPPQSSSSRILGPSGRSTSGLRAPSAGRTPASQPEATAAPRQSMADPAANGGFALPEPVRKLSGIARPTSGGIPRPGTTASRLPAFANRSMGAPGRRAASVSGPAAAPKLPASYQPRQPQGNGWMEDCY